MLRWVTKQLKNYLHFIRVEIYVTRFWQKYHHFNFLNFLMLTDVQIMI